MHIYKPVAPSTFLICTVPLSNTARNSYCQMIPNPVDAEHQSTALTSRQVHSFEAVLIYHTLKLFSTAVSLCKDQTVLL